MTPVVAIGRLPLAVHRHVRRRPFSVGKRQTVDVTVNG